MRRTHRYWVRPKTGEIVPATPGCPVPPSHILIDTGSVELTERDKRELRDIMLAIGLDVWECASRDIICDIILDELALFMVERYGGVYVPTPASD